jgi:hypothetical protein
LACADRLALFNTGEEVAERMESMNPKHNPVMEPMVAPKAVFRNRSEVW